MTRAVQAAFRRLPLMLPAALLVSCWQPVVPEPSFVGQASLSGVLVQGPGEPAVPGSAVLLLSPGDHARVLSRTRTDAGGQFAFDDIPAGRYDLRFSAHGYAASELLGAEARDRAPWRYTVLELPVRDAGGADGVPALAVTELPSGQQLGADTELALPGRLKARVQTVPGSAHVPPLRQLGVSLLTPDEAGELTELVPVGGSVNPPPTPGVADSGPLDLSVGSVRGAALLQVTATDFNNNRVAALFPVNVVADPGGTVLPPQDVRAVAYTWPGMGGQPRLKVQLTWSTPSLEGVRGFEIWRSGSAAGPWTRALLAATDRCQGSLCTVADTSPALTVGSDYHYRVTSVGQNRAESAAGPLPSTHTLPLIRPSLISPVAGQDSAALTPEYTVQSNEEVSGASGSSFELNVRDDLLGNTVPWAVSLQLRHVRGQAGQTPEQTDDQLVLLRGGRSEVVYSSLNPALGRGGVRYDASTGQVSLTHNFDGSGSVLQPARRYRWTLGRAAAFRIQNPARPLGALNPVVAYSVSSDPTGSGAQDCPALPLLPAGPCLDGGPSLEFTTGAGP